MAPLAPLSFLAGTVLGMRFRVLVLIPAIVLCAPNCTHHRNQSSARARITTLLSRCDRSEPADRLFCGNCNTL